MQIFNSHNFFGVHKISNSLYSFILYAPGAIQVKLQGDFNNWSPYQMELVNNQVWVLIAEAQEGQRYQYVITTDEGDFIKTDPYSFAMQDEYSIVFDINSIDGTTKFPIEDNFFSKPLNIYEIYLGGWNEKYKTYRDMAEPLVEYLKKYSFNAVEFLPITEYPIDKTWGYQPVGFFAPTNRYGAPEDLKYLIDTLHANGIYVILDWTPAHFDPWEYGLINFDGKKLYEYPEEKFETHPIWKTKCFNWCDEYVSSFLISSANFWLDVYGFDGLRIDTVTTILQLFTINEDNQVDNCHHGIKEQYFLKYLTSTLKALHPNAILIAEETQGFGNITSKEGLEFQYKQGLGWSWDTGSWIHAENKQEGIFGLIRPLDYAHENKQILTYGHDQIAKSNGFLKQQLKTFEPMKVFYGYCMTFPGKKCFFMGNEYGQDGYWDYYRYLNFEDNDFARFVQELNKFYTLHPALFEKDYESDGINSVELNAEKQVLSFVRHSNDEDLLCVFNFGSENFDHYWFKLEGQYSDGQEIFSTHYGWNLNPHIEGNGLSCQLPANSFIVYKIQ